MSDHALPVFDAHGLLERMEGDVNLARLVVISAEEDLTGLFDRLEQAVASADWSAAQTASHTMKSLLLQTGGVAAGTRMQALNLRLKNGGTADAGEIAALRADYRALQSALADWLAAQSQ